MDFLQFQPKHIFVIKSLIYYSNSKNSCDLTIVKKYERSQNADKIISCFDIKNSIRETEKIWNNLIDIASHTEYEFNKNIPMVDYYNDFKAYLIILKKAFFREK